MRSRTACTIASVEIAVCIDGNASYVTACSDAPRGHRALVEAVPDERRERVDDVGRPRGHEQEDREAEVERELQRRARRRAARGRAAARGAASSTTSGRKNIVAYAYARSSVSHGAWIASSDHAGDEPSSADVGAHERRLDAAVDERGQAHRAARGSRGRRPRTAPTAAARARRPSGRRTRHRRPCSTRASRRRSRGTARCRPTGRAAHRRATRATIASATTAATRERAVGTEPAQQRASRGDLRVVAVIRERRLGLRVHQAQATARARPSRRPRRSPAVAPATASQRSAARDRHLLLVDRRQREAEARTPSTASGTTGPTRGSFSVLGQRAAEHAA